MTGISGVRGEPIQAEGRVPNPPPARRSGKAQGPRKDTVFMDRTPQMQARAEARFGEFLKRLQAAHPELQIVISDGPAACGDDLLSRTLRDMGDGYALLLSREFMARLGADEGACRRKAQAVLEVVRRLGRFQKGAAAWLGEEAAAVLMRTSDAEEERTGWVQAWGRRQEEALSDLLPSSAAQEQAKSGSPRSACYQTGAAYSKLAGAKTKTAVQSVAAEVRRSISALKLVAAYGDDKARLKAKKALKSLERLLLLANKKMRRFDDEQLTEIRRKRAQEDKEKEMQAALELKRRRTSRATGDGAILTEGRLNRVSLPAHWSWAEEQRLKKLYRDPAEDELAVLPTAAGILAAVSGAELGGMPAPEGFQMVDVITY